jgi:heme A synthase
MIADAIEFFFREFSAVMLVLALLIAAVNPKRQSVPGRFLAWILLLSIGLSGLWGAAFHIFFPGVAAADIG